MLEIKNLSVFYGGIHALQGIDLDVPDRKIVTLIGANGAGKSTTLRAIAGLIKPSSGEVILQGSVISGRPTLEIVQKGLALVPEGRRIFSNLSVEENLLLGAYSRTDKKAVLADLEHVYELSQDLGEKRAERWNALGRRTADACGGSRAYVETQTAHDG